MQAIKFYEVNTSNHYLNQDIEHLPALQLSHTSSASLSTPCKHNHYSDCDDQLFLLPVFRLYKNVIIQYVFSSVALLCSIVCCEILFYSCHISLYAYNFGCYEQVSKRLLNISCYPYVYLSVWCISDSEYAGS